MMSAFRRERGFLATKLAAKPVMFATIPVEPIDRPALPRWAKTVDPHGINSARSRPPAAQVS
jgi:hypothetical protein